jgi:hypothetical protein
MTRTILALLACSVISQSQTAAPTATGSYHFVTPQSQRGLEEAATIVKTVASAPQVSADESTGTLSYTGSSDSVNFTNWLLPQIDQLSGDNAVHEYRLPSGDIGRVNFVPNVQKPQEMQELLTAVRTVADVQKIFTFTSNHAIVLRGPEWTVTFAEWIIDQINQAKPDSTPHEFTVGGPDFRGAGHGARLNYLFNMTSPRQLQEVLTVLRVLSDVQKVFSYTGTHVLVMRAGDTDLARAEWLIQQLDLPAGQASGPSIFTVPTGDDVTRIFRLRNANPQFLQTAAKSLRSDLSIKRVFQTTEPSNIVVRGTADQISAANAWMTAHNALSD